ncbi:hypothetical protein C0995_008980 [Termitomyces sp. Mi166|nr:hypothetical protein C0995_008980 [Termitomyces sp. Mi166\
MEKDEVPHFTFVEEPLGLPASEGYGYFQGGPGQILGPKPGFRIENKLQVGTSGSLWLARDLCKDQFVAIKILIGYASQVNREEKLRESKVLQRLSVEDSVPMVSTPTSPFVTKLWSYFYHPGAEGDGEHLCLVMDLLCSDVGRICFSLTRRWSPPTSHCEKDVKSCNFGISTRSRAWHSSYRFHGRSDIKLDNIMVAPSKVRTHHTIAEWLKNNPPQTYPPTPSLMGMVTSFVSKQLPDPTVDDLATATFQIADWGQAQIVDDQTTDDVTPLLVRPPEIILGGEWDQSVDIWTYGCLVGVQSLKKSTYLDDSIPFRIQQVFRALTNKPLFEFEDPGEFDRNDEEAIQKMCVVAAGSDPTSLITGPISIGNLKKFKHYDYIPIQDRIRAHSVPFSEDEVEKAAAFMMRCLRLDPKERSTAMQLADDPWFDL